MTLLQTLVAFFVAIAVLVFVHEFGHYLAARLCGVKVLRFSIGMGKVIYSRRIGRDQAEWALSMLPVGGYVKMLDAREQDLSSLPAQDLAREFTRQPVWKRMVIVAAGPLANFLLAIGLFAGLYSYGIPEPMPLLRAVPERTAAHQAGLRGGELVTSINGEPVQAWSELRWKLLQLALERTPAHIEVKRPNPDRSISAPDAVVMQLNNLSIEDLEGDFLAKVGLDLARPKPVLGKLIDGGPAMQAGLQEGDILHAVNGRHINDGLAFIEIVRVSPNEPLLVEGSRRGEKFSVTVIPEAYSKNGKVIGQIKAELPLAPAMVVVSDPPLAAIGKAIQRTWDTSVLTLKMLGKMLIGEVSWRNVSGPITIADYAGQTARIGIISYLTFVAIVSVSLAVMNLLPIPVLDGGLLLYYSLELLTGRAIPARLGEIAQRAGVGILMTLMAVAVFNDIVRLIS